MAQEYTEVYGRVVRTTQMAVLVNCDGLEAWLPKSQMQVVEGSLERGAEVTLNIPQWLAESNYLI
jgi:hypothetical protein